MSSLLQGFADSVDFHADRPALYIGTRRWTYDELGAQAGRIAGAVAERGLSQHRPVGLLARDSLTAYAGMVAILASGRPFVPIEPAGPPARIEEVIAELGVDTIVVGNEALDRLDSLLECVGRPLAIIAPETDDLRGAARRHPRHRYQTRCNLPAPCRPVGSGACPGATAYIAYTSGASGIGRPVAVSRRNLRAYLDAVDRRIPTYPEDRCSHTFPMTFDQSIHDLLTAWSNGAAVVAWTADSRSQPGRFIRRHRLTRWASVPETAATMDRLGELSPGQFPTLRESLFCGGRLPVSLAYRWNRAAPNSSVVAMYGPVEATVAVSCHRFEPQSGQPSFRHGLVPIGEPFDRMKFRVVDTHGNPVGPGGRGELLVGGRQVAGGYPGDPEATQRRFEDGGSGEEHGWFRTRDVVERGSSGQLYLVGRADDRIRLRGHRVEISVVERVLQRVCGRQSAAVGWPRTDSGARGLLGLIVSDEPVDDCEIRARCRRHLPNTMVPDRVIELAELPVDERGDIDRKAMVELLKRREVIT